MAFSQVDVEALEQAIASGAKVLRMDGREYEYQSIAQMRAALGQIRSEVADAAALAASRRRRPRQFRARTSGGYC